MSTPEAIGRYQVVRRLGAGGMGAVYLVRDPELDRAVAIKLVKDDLTDEPELRERFSREARSAARLHHPNIITIFDVGEHDGRPFIAMEYIAGESLSDIVRRVPNLDVGWVFNWMEQLCLGLAHAHKTGVVHRDIKPANLMVDQDGVLKIVDFGIARAGESQLTRSGVLVGTANYLSPEQLLGGVTDHRADIFAVGAVFYELLAGRKAFPGTIADGLFNRICNERPEALATICPTLDPNVERVVDGALDKDPARRYQNLALMAADISRLRARQPVVGPGPSTADGATMTSAPLRPASSAVGAATPPLGSSPSLRPPPAVGTASGSSPALGSVPPSGASTPAMSTGSNTSAESPTQRRRRAEVFVDAAEMALGERDYEKARKLIDDAARFDSSVEGLPDLRARVEQEEGAAIAAERLRAESEASLNEASSCLARGDYTAARDRVRQALAADPGNFRAQSMADRVRQAEASARNRVQHASAAPSQTRRGLPWLWIILTVVIVAAAVAAFYFVPR